MSKIKWSETVDELADRLKGGDVDTAGVVILASILTAQRKQAEFLSDIVEQLSNTGTQLENIDNYLRGR